MDNKRDLTRIEDLGEFLHELDDDAENYLELPALPQEEGLDSLPEDMPDLPSEELPELPPEDDNPFGSDTSFETETTFGESTDFSSEGETNFGQETTFGEEPAFGEETNFETEEMAPAEESEPEPETVDFATEAIEESQDVLSAVSESISEAANAEPEEDYSSPLDIDPMPEEVQEVETRAPEVEETPIEQEYSAKEDFTETRNFAQKAVLDDSPAECNPAYSVIARNIRFLEDSEEILSLLKEVGFPSDMMEQFKRQIERGTLLIPRISEFTAIYVSHRLRRFRLELQMGLSDILHAPKKTREEDKGLVSRKTLGQNQHHAFQFKGDSEGARNIILSTLSQLDGHAIDRYLGVASEHTFLEAEAVENETSEAIHKTYDELAQKLKGHALHHKANAVLGINYQLTPMPTEGSLGQYRYKLTCTGNLVWVHKLSV